MFIPLDSPLAKALFAANETTLRHTLLKICRESEEAHKLAMAEMFVEQPVEQPVKQSSNGEPASKKRKHDTNEAAETALVRRYARCKNCKEDYDVHLNLEHGEGKECIWHDGELEIMDEDFPDDDEVQYGNVDPYTDWRREEFPDGFEWTCCEGNANAEGCRKTRHDCDNSTDDESPSEEEESDESDNEDSIL